MRFVAVIFSLSLLLPVSGKAALRILPLGDSITQGIFPHQSYRYRLWQKLINAGIECDIVGSRTANLEGNSSYPPYGGMNFDRHHEGHSGWRSIDLLDGCTASDSCTTKNEGYLAQWLGGYTPDIALLHIGTNDIFQSAPLSLTVASIHSIIDGLRGDDPNVIVLLAKIIPLPGNRSIPTASLNMQIESIAASRTTAQSPVIIVDQHAGFSTTADTYDGTHPDTSGEEKVAQKWFDAIQAALIPPNAPPVAAAGPDQTIRWLTDEATVAGYTADDGNPAGGQLVRLWTRDSGPGTVSFSNPFSSVSAISFSAPGTYTLRLTATDGELFASDTMQVTVEPYDCQLVTREEAGLIVFEAEDYIAKGYGSLGMAGRYWRTTTDWSGYSGAAAMISYPEALSVANSTDTTAGPRLDYWVDFVQTGTWYVWLRMLGPGPSEDSLHAGLDGAPATYGLRGMEDSSAIWHWEQMVGAGRVQFEVDTPGRHVFSVWARDDGTYLDRVVLARDPGYTPVGFGPGETIQEPLCDFDGDLVDDLWELATYGGLGQDGSDNQDGDNYGDFAEYVAGTLPDDPTSYPRVTRIMVNGGVELAFPAAAGRRYDVEFRDDPIGGPGWQPLAPDLPGVDPELIVPDPDGVPSRLYRYRARLD